MKIIPRGKFVLVRQDDEGSRISENGIITPSNVEQEKKAFGAVVSFGKEITDLHEGQRVVFGTYAGDRFEITENGKDASYILLHDDEVLALIFDE